MFNSTDGNAIAVAQGRIQAGINHVIPACRDCAATADNISPLEDHTCVGFCGAQGHRDFSTGVQSDTDAINRAFEGFLLTEFNTGSFWSGGRCR